MGAKSTGDFLSVVHKRRAEIALELAELIKQLHHIDGRIARLECKSPTAK